MRIARLELHGFKSFADRTMFHFGAGISCVVGPNGCGKSNVVDALKWVIGEMSARSLRGEDMMDVIFAGSAERKPVGYAEVALTFSAEGGEPFPGELARFSEVQIARRLYRDGNSEYLLNQTRCRRKDIVDLIMDSGVGNHLYSFIEQGRIDKIVSASPEERRSLIDEAAGITRYKLRRQEAQQKLEATCGQLDRAADVVDEMGKRLGVLEKQVVRAARFRRLRALVRQHEIALSLIKVRDLRAELEGGQARLAEVSQIAVSSEREADALESDLGLRRAELEIAASAVGRARDELVEIDAARRAADAVRGLHARRVDEASAQMEEARAEIDAAFSRGELARSEQERSSAELLDLQERLVEEAATVEIARAEAEDAERRLSETRSTEATAALDAERSAGALRELRARTDAASQRLADLSAAVVRAEARLTAWADEAVVLDKRIAVAEGAVVEARAEIEALDAEREEVAGRLDEAVRKEVHARDAVGRAEHEGDAAQRAWTAAVGQVDAVNSKLDERVAAEVASLLRKEDEGFGARAREASRRLAEVEDSERRRLAEASAQAQARREAQRASEERESEAWRQEAQAAFDKEDHERQVAVDESVRAAAREVQEVEGGWRAEHEALVGEARARRDEADAGLEAARGAQRDVEARLARAERALREADGALAALQAERTAIARRDKGAAAVASALPGAQRLVELLDAAEIARQRLAPVLGERLQLPVVHDEATVRRLADVARSSGRARVLLVRGELGLEAVVAATQVVDDIGAAARGFLASGGAWRVRGTGERVDADGVVHLGDAAGEAEAGLDLERRLREAERAQAEATTAADALRGEQTRARARVEAAGIGARKAMERADALEKEGRTAGVAKTAAAREAGDKRVAAMRAAWQGWRAQARQALDAELKQRRSGVGARMDEARKVADQELGALRAEVEQRIATVRAEVEAAGESLRQERSRRAEELRAQVAARLREGLVGLLEERDRRRGDMDRCSRVLQQARERSAEAARGVERVRQEVERAAARVAERRQVLARLEAELATAREQRRSLAERTVSAQEERQRADDERRRLEGQSAGLGAELAEIEARATRAGVAREQAQRALREAEQVASQLRRRSMEADGRLAGLRERRAQAEASLHASARQAKDAEERLDAARGRLGSVARQHDEARVEVAKVEAELDALAVRRQAAVSAVGAAQEAEDAARIARDLVQTGLVESSARRDRARREQLELEDRTRRAEQELGTVRSRLDERYQVDIDHLLDHLLEASGLSLPASEEARAGLEIGGRRIEPVEDLIVRPEMLDDAETVRGLVGRMEELRTELGRLGDVNLTALEEYSELKVRFDDLETQRTDLDSSVQSIRAAIAKMNKTCRERFRETFDRVDESFRKAYPELVGGGEAHLSLTDEEDLLETGVEIFVRPPGKRLQTLSLLSGGEKAMTAIALLLALFSVKPSPFCVLDEVDAPLDEANGARFNDMLRQMARITQFIVITHNRKTMECADTLYGITMPVPGCSALVSVQVD